MNSNNYKQKFEEIYIAKTSSMFFVNIDLGLHQEAIKTIKISRILTIGSYTLNDFERFFSHWTLIFFTLTTLVSHAGVLLSYYSSLIKLYHNSIRPVKVKETNPMQSQINEFYNWFF